MPSRTPAAAAGSWSWPHADLPTGARPPRATSTASPPSRPPPPRHLPAGEACARTPAHVMLAMCHVLAPPGPIRVRSPARPRRYPRLGRGPDPTRRSRRRDAVRPVQRCARIRAIPDRGDRPRLRRRGPDVRDVFRHGYRQADDRSSRGGAGGRLTDDTSPARWCAASRPEPGRRCWPRASSCEPSRSTTYCLTVLSGRATFAVMTAASASGTKRRRATGEATTQGACRRARRPAHRDRDDRRLIDRCLHLGREHRNVPGGRPAPGERNASAAWSTPPAVRARSSPGAVAQPHERVVAAASRTGDLPSCAVSLAIRWRCCRARRWRHR